MRLITHCPALISNLTRSISSMGHKQRLRTCTSPTHVQRCLSLQVALHNTTSRLQHGPNQRGVTLFRRKVEDRPSLPVAGADEVEEGGLIMVFLKVSRPRTPYTLPALGEKYP